MTEGEVIKAIVDTDPGIDDALALMMAIRSPELDVLGITTVGGNASLARTTRNALSLLEHLAASDIPVHAGAARPLRGRFRYAHYHHGPGGLTVRLPGPRSAPAPPSAAEYIADLARAMPGSLTLIALGPLTNIARAIALEPMLKRWIRQIVIMGGAVGVPGNVTDHAEFNVYNDPAAARLVLSSGIPTTLVGLDVCNEVSVTRTDGWPSGGSPAADLARRMLSNWYAGRANDARFSLCDPLAVAALLRPGIFRFRDASVGVETEDSERLGRTTARYGDGTVKVAVAVDVEEAKGFIDSLL